MRVSEKIDWLSITFPSDTRLVDIIPRYDDESLVRIKSPIPVYNDAWQLDPYGIKILSGEERLGKHVIMSGSVLDNLRKNEVSMLEIWALIKNNGGKVGRIDVAIDVMDDPSITPQTVKDQYLKGNCSTKIQRNKHIGEDGKDQTFYIGRMDSKIHRFRVYDKAIEQGLAETVWTRIEYEKRKNANNTARAIFDNEVELRSIVKNVVDFPKWKEWQSIFDVPLAPIPRGESEEKVYYDKLLWLINSVPQAIVNAMILEYRDKLSDFTIDNSEVLSAFTKVLSGKLIEAQLKGELPMLEPKDE